MNNIITRIKRIRLNHKNKWQYYKKPIITKRTRKQFSRMLNYLTRKGVYEPPANINLFFDNNYFDENSDFNYRFLIHPELFRMVCQFWKPELVPLVMEILYTLGMWQYRKTRNLLGLFICDLENDNHNWELRVEKMELLKIAFEIGESIDEISGDFTWRWETFDRAKRVSSKLNNSPIWFQYYQQIINPITRGIRENGAWNQLFQDKNWKAVMKKLQLTPELDEEVVQFIIEDAMECIEASDCSSYNPYWMFGSKNYYELFANCPDDQKGDMMYQKFNMKNSDN